MAYNVFEAMAEGFRLLWDYLSQHTLTCLVPAFFIAGAIAVFVRKDAILRYLGPRVQRRVSYPIASVSGAVLAVCSCTILPLFAGIYRKGAGIGPASAFLYSGPAINIMAIAFTASALGWDLGLARALSAIALSVLVGMGMALMFRGEEGARAREEARDQGADPAAPGPSLQADGGERGPRWPVPATFALLVAILVVGTAAVPLPVKVVAVLAMALVVAYIAWARFTADEREDWGWETWDLTKKILPALLVGAFIVGVFGYYVPPGTFASHLGGNSLGAVLLAALIGGVLYMPTLLEVPIVGDVFGYSDGVMAAGPALALLLAGPAVSLPNMIVLYRLVGARKTAAYIALVVVASTVAGWAYGNLVI